MPVGVVLGSAFSGLGARLEPEACDTPFGPVTVHREPSRGGLVLFRHGLPHRWLPHQVPLRAQAWALRALGCEALVISSSVGVLDPAVPLFTPLLVGDVVMLEEKLPDGSPCTMWVAPSPEQGHLVLEHGLVSAPLGRQLRALGDRCGATLGVVEPVFVYRAGPRTKTRVENALLARLGMQVNSMSLAPELVLANELGIPCAGLVVGHKRSGPQAGAPDRQGIADSLHAARAAMERLALAWLAEGEAVPFENHLYRY